MSAALERINAHLRALKAELATMSGDIAARRAVLDRYFRVDPSVTRCQATVTPVDIDGIPGEWVVDRESRSGDRLLYLHGGSWISGSLAAYRPHVGRLAAATACEILAVNYRLAPEHPFPAGLDDCVSALRWLRDNGPGGAAPANRCFIAGDSAGGNLALAAMLKLARQGEPLPDAAVLFAPATDLTWSSPSLKSLAERDVIINAALLPKVSAVYLDGADATDPLVSPLFGDLDGLPPMLLQVSDAEALHDDSVRFAEAAGASAVLEVYRDVPHVFQGFAPLLPDALEALRAVSAFIKDV